MNPEPYESPDDAPDFEVYKQGLDDHLEDLADDAINDIGD